MVVVVGSMKEKMLHPVQLNGNYGSNSNYIRDIFFMFNTHPDLFTSMPFYGLQSIYQQ